MAKHKRSPKGSVTVHRNGNMTKLRWTYAGKPVSLGPGIPYTLVGKRAAEALAKQIEADIWNRNYDPSLARYRPQPEREVLSAIAIFERFVESERVKGIDPDSIKSHYKAARRHLDSTSDTIDPVEAQRLFSEHLKGLKRTSKTKYLGHYKRAWSWATVQGFADSNPFDGVKLAKDVKSKNPVKPFTDSEIAAIMATAKDYSGGTYHGPILAMLSLGTRPSEVCGLQWSDLDLQTSTYRPSSALVNNSVKPIKSGAGRQVPLSRSLSDYLTLRRPDRPSDALVFVAAHGGGLRTDALRRAFKAILKRAGIEYRSPNKMRHTVSSQLESRGIPATERAKILGHSPRVNIDTYTHAMGTDVSMPEVDS